MIVSNFFSGRRTLWKHITTSIPLLACWTHKGIEEFVFFLIFFFFLLELTDPDEMPFIPTVDDEADDDGSD